MGQCTSIHAVPPQQVGTKDTKATMKRGPPGSSNDSSLVSKPSSTFGKMTKYLAENPTSHHHPKRKGSFILFRDSASAPMGEDMLSSFNCSATFNMEMSNSSSLDLITPPVSSRSKSPRRTITPPSNASSDIKSKGSSPTVTNVTNHHQHCWAALRDVTDRDYCTLDPLPEELAIRSSSTSSSSASPTKLMAGSSSIINPDHKPKKEEYESKQGAMTVVDAESTPASAAGSAGGGEAARQEESPPLKGRRRSRRRSSRDWKRSSMLYNKPSPTSDQQHSAAGTTNNDKKESSWQALSCTSKNSNMSYESYASSNRSWLILASFDSGRNTTTTTGGSSNMLDFGRYEKEAMTNMHGICFTDSEDENDDVDDSHDEQEEREPHITNNESSSGIEESKFWETNALRS